MLDLDNETLIANNPELSNEELEELFAIKALLVRPSYILTNICAFEKFCFSVNGIIPNPETVDIPNILMVGNAIQKIKKNLKYHSYEELSKNLSHTLICYIAHIAFDEGWVIMPSVLSFAQDELNKLTSNFAKNIFISENSKTLLSKKPWDDNDPISCHCAKSQALEEYLKMMQE